MDKSKVEVILPLDDLVALYAALQAQERSSQELVKLRNEVDGLRFMLHECMLLINDLKKGLGR